MGGSTGVPGCTPRRRAGACLAGQRRHLGRAHADARDGLWVQHLGVVWALRRLLARGRLVGTLAAGLFAQEVARHDLRKYAQQIKRPGRRETKRRETQLPPRPQLLQRHVLHNGIGGSWWRAMARLAIALNTSKPVDRLSGRALRRVVGDRSICADTATQAKPADARR